MFGYPPHIQADKLAMDQLVSSAGTQLVVHWVNRTGGTLDEITGYIVGATETPLSGVVQALGVQETPKYVLRQFQEIQAGDLIVDLSADPIVEIFPGQQVQSGTVALVDLKSQGVRFEWLGRLYSQQDLGKDLAEAWSVVVGGTKMVDTLLLRRET